MHTVFRRLTPNFSQKWVVSWCEDTVIGDTTVDARGGGARPHRWPLSNNTVDYTCVIFVDSERGRLFPDGCSAGIPAQVKAYVAEFQGL